MARLITSPKSDAHYFVIVVFLVVLSGVTFTLLYIWALPGQHTHKETPHVETYSYLNAGDFYVLIQKVDPILPSVRKVNFILLDEQWNGVSGEQGSVSEIYGLNFDDTSTNITFLDMDINGKLSGGDFLKIKNVNNGGQAKSGYFFLLKFDITGDKMNGKGTRLG